MNFWINEKKAGNIISVRCRTKERILHSLKRRGETSLVTGKEGKVPLPYATKGKRYS